MPAPPSGTVTVEARLQQNEGPLAGRTAPSGEIPSIDLAAVAKQLGAPTYTGAYGQVRSESPSAPIDEMQRIVPQPEDTGVDTGTHLSYAIQWIIFALLGFGALGWSIRRDLLDAGDEVVTAAEERAIVRRVEARTLRRGSRGRAHRATGARARRGRPTGRRADRRHGAAS